MTTAHPTTPPGATSSGTAPRTVSPVRLAWLHLKFQFLETVRIPMAVIGNALFPALAMAFFVVPQPEVAGNPAFATMAVAGLALFGVCSASLFTYGLGVAEDRALPFDPFVRSLPAGPGPRMVARVGNGGIFTLIGLAPLIVVAWLFTDAAVTAPELGAGIGMILLTSVPFVLLGMGIGYSLTAKAALPVVQVILFPLAFAGGLFLPPMMFPAWLDTLSQLTPTRAGRDLLVQALTGIEANPWAWPVLLGWTVVFAALAAWAYRRDEGRRFR
jgi:ABC-2 type transport system permease protein